MVSWLRRRWLFVSSLAFAGWARRFRRARDPRTTVAWSVSRRVRRDDVAREYGTRTAQESLRLKLIGLGRAAHFPRCAAASVIRTGDPTGHADMREIHRPCRGLPGVHSRCGLHTRSVTVFRDRYPGASDISSPPCLPRLLPAGAIAGWGLHPLEKRRLVTAHAESRTCREPRPNTNRRITQSRSN